MSGVITSALSAYPNPFNSAVTISVGCRGLINQTPTVEIFDIAGRMVKDLINTNGTSVWDGSNDRGLPLPSGVYLVEGENNGKISTRVVTLLK